MTTTKPSATKETDRETSKDFWDKLSSFSTFFSSVIIAGVGLAATNIISTDLKDREIKVTSVEALASYVPLTKGNDTDQITALTIMNSVGQTEVAISVAGTLSNPTVENSAKRFLRNIAASGDARLAEMAQKELDRLNSEAAYLDRLRGGFTREGSFGQDLRRALSQYPFEVDNPAYTLDEAENMLEFIGAQQTLPRPEQGAVTGSFPNDGENAMEVTIWPNSYDRRVYGVRYGQMGGEYWGSNETYFEVAK